MELQTMVVTDYHKKRTTENVQKKGTMEFPTRWRLCCTGKQSCESRSRDHISTYQTRKEKKNTGQVPRSVTLKSLTPGQLKLGAGCAYAWRGMEYSGSPCLRVPTRWVSIPICQKVMYHATSSWPYLLRKTNGYCRTSPLLWSTQFFSSTLPLLDHTRPHIFQPKASYQTIAHIPQCHATRPHGKAAIANELTSLRGHAT